MEIPKVVTAHFPSRLLHINKTVEVDSVVSLLVGMVAILLSFLILYFGAPDLLHDYEISKNPIEVNAKIDGECRNKKWSTNCNLTLAYQGEKIKRSFSFSAFNEEDYYVTAMASKDKPELLTVNLAIDKIMNRLITLVVHFLLAFTVGVGFIFLSLHDKKMDLVLAKINNKSLIPVLVPVTIRFAQGVMIAEYCWPKSQLSQEYFASFKVKTEGGILEVPIGAATQTYALGVTTDLRAVPILLDKTLNRIDLTIDEKAKLLEAIYSEA